MMRQRREYLAPPETQPEPAPPETLAIPPAPTPAMQPETVAPGSAGILPAGPLEEEIGLYERPEPEPAPDALDREIEEVFDPAGVSEDLYQTRLCEGRAREERFLAATRAALVELRCPVPRPYCTRAAVARELEAALAAAQDEG